MNLSEPFIRRPVMTSLVMITFLFFGLMAYRSLPVSNLPNIDYPVIVVTTRYPGSGPDTIADTITSPLEREFTAIDGIKTISSNSQNGSSTIVLQFVLNKDLNVAAQDVQAALDRAAPNLPNDLPNNPTYQKTNPTDMPVLYLAIKSNTMTLGELYEYAYSVLGRRLGMIEGVSNAKVYGSKFAVRVQVDPDKLATHQIGIDEIVDTIKKSNPQKPVGNLYGKDIEYTLNVDGQMQKAEGYNQLIIRNHEGALLKIKDVGRALNSLENDKYALDYYTKESKTPCVVIGVVKQSGSNTIKVIEGCKTLVKKIEKELPGSVDVSYLFDQSSWILESIEDVQFTLILSIILVVIVILFYLGKILDAIVPLLSIPIAVIGTFAFMSFYHFNIDILSLLAITLSIGFLVDDAIVVMENIMRHVEMGKTTWEAALNGSKQISFTVLAMTLSLISVFIPMVFMEGVMGRIFREFGVTIVTAVLISGVISLSLTPMLCSKLVASSLKKKKKNFIERLSEKLDQTLLEIYKKGLAFTFKHRLVVLITGIACCLLTLYLAMITPSDFFPEDDLGFIQGFGVAGDATSPFKMIDYQKQISDIVRRNPNVADLVAASALPTSNQSMMFIRLKDYKKRQSIQKVISELLSEFKKVPGLNIFLRSVPLISLDVGTTASMGNYQYTLQSLNSTALYQEASKMLSLMKNNPFFKQVSSDMHNDAPYVKVKIDRNRAYDLNVSAESLELAFDYAYSGSEISRINNIADQHYVIVETLPFAYNSPTDLDKLYISASTSSLINTQNKKADDTTSFPTQVPLKEIVKIEEEVGPLSIAHLNTLPSVTITFDLAPKVPLSKVLQNLNKMSQNILKTGVTARVQGSADVFKKSFKSLGFLFLITLFLIYVILGILYENLIHPITVMSALPPAGLGAFLTLFIFREPLSIYAFVGIMMLLGIVLKNGIMMIDFANGSLSEGNSIQEAIYEACCQRLRPILMTTFSAMMGAVPIAIGIGGLTAQSRRPLGLVIVGGLILSQILTLFFTPIIFIYLEKLREYFKYKKG